MEVIALDLTKRYTVEDYLSWTFEQSCELIDGFVRWMSAPSYNHAFASISLFRILDNFILTKKDDYVVFYAPVAVILDKNSVVEPDIFICRKTQLKNNRCQGAPVFIVEILSPSNPENDTEKKLNLYLKHSIQEYWIVSPDKKTVTVNILLDGEYQTILYAEIQTITLVTFPEISIEVNKIFENIE